ncbi:MAG: hypothetical protein ABW252_13215 [Polyangiales bacterium]
MKSVRQHVRIPAVVGFLLALLASSAHAEYTRYPAGHPTYASEGAGHFAGMAEGVRLSMHLNLDPTFDGWEKALLKDSLRVFMERGLTSQVLSCAIWGSTKDGPTSQAQLLQQLVTAFRERLIQQGTKVPGNVHIARSTNEPKAAAAAFSGLFYNTDRPLFNYTNRHYLYIAVNGDFLGGDAEPWMSDVDWWAGSIGHEFLHNLGYNHPTGYPGSFVSVYGDCVTSNGAPAAAPKGRGGQPVMGDHVFPM